MTKFPVVYDFTEDKAKIWIEPEIIDYAKWLAPKIAERSGKNIGSQNNIQGLLGQELFYGFLLQCKIPHIYANAIYKDMKIRKMENNHFDFIVPHMPTGKQIISIKTVPEGENYVRFLANVDGWKDETHDIAIAVKIESLVENKAYLAGWLKAETVESLPIYDWGEGDAYWTYLNSKTVGRMVELNKEMPRIASPKLKPLNSINPLIESICLGSFDPQVRKNPFKYIKNWKVRENGAR